MLGQSRLHALLHYDPDTGVFTWRPSDGWNRRAGKVAGSAIRQGYRRIFIDGRNYLAHRLAWLYVTGSWPVDIIDHINRVTSDNRFCNLREATKSLNRANSPGDKPGHPKGVTWHRGARRWQAQITVNGIARYIGLFVSQDAALRAYREAAQEAFGSFACFEQRSAAP